MDENLPLQLYNCESGLDNRALPPTRQSAVEGKTSVHPAWALGSASTETTRPELRKGLGFDLLFHGTESISCRPAA